MRYRASRYARWTCCWYKEIFQKKEDIICLFEKKAVPLRHEKEESCLSGRKSRTRNAVYAQVYRGFESLTFRRKKKICCPSLLEQADFYFYA